MKGKFKIFTKEPNRKLFNYVNTWEISKGWYDDGNGQYITKFESVPIINRLNHHYYRFHRYGADDTAVYWLDLNFFENIRFRLMQFTGQDFFNCLATIGAIGTLIGTIVSFVTLF